MFARIRVLYIDLFFYVLILTLIYKFSVLLVYCVFRVKHCIENHVYLLLFESDVDIK